MIISDGINHSKLQSIIVGELKKAGLKHRLKKIILKNIKDHKTIFGAPLIKVPSCSVICCGSTLRVPMVVGEMSTVLRENAHIEGLFRKAGSQNRQKDIKRLLDAGGCVSEGHHPIDVASVLKLYLRCLPEPLIGTEVQDLLLRCRITAGDDALKPILHTLLLLPVLHVHLLHYIMELLNFIASHHKENLMDSTNLAIVMTPSIMPLPAAATAQRLEHHVALVKIFIENSEHIGLLTEDLMNQLDSDSDVYLTRRKKRRSGSLNRVLSGLRKMVSGSVNTPATVCENGKTPILCKSASKRKFQSHEGLSVKTKNAVKENLPQRELAFTPMKMGLERKRLRLSMMDARSTPTINTATLQHKDSETSISSEDMVASSEHLFSAHDTIDLSPENKQTGKDYVRISKQEYEEIKNRVSAIENRLSREFTDHSSLPYTRVQPLQQVQNVYEQTLEDVAMLHCPTSDNLARRLSKELKIRPNEQAKVIRSPSARKIGSIRRRSRENLTKIVRHKSWNVSSQSQASQQSDRFYPYVGLTKRNRTSSGKSTTNTQSTRDSQWDASSDTSFNNTSQNSRKYLRKRSSLAPDYTATKSNTKQQSRRSLNITTNTSWDGNASEVSINNTFSSSNKSNISDEQTYYQNIPTKPTSTIKSGAKSQHKWRSAAAFFMDKTGEIDNSSQTGRPSVNKLRKQNAGAVLAKAKLFETSSDKSSEGADKNSHSTFARKPRLNNANPKLVAHVKPKIQVPQRDAARVTCRINDADNCNIKHRTYRPSPAYREEVEHWRNRKFGSPNKKVISPQPPSTKTPVMKKPLCTSRNLRTPVINTDSRKNTPMKAIHTSPRRKSPRQKLQRAYIH